MAAQGAQAADFSSLALAAPGGRTPSPFSPTPLHSADESTLSPPVLRLHLHALFAASGTHAQLVLPGAAPAAPQGAATAPPKPKPAARRTRRGGDRQEREGAAAPGVASLVGRPLLLNGKTGLFQISGDDKMVTIDKLQLAGEGVSDPSQRCVVDIVGEKPIEATNVGRPDGLERFEADIPGLPDLLRRRWTARCWCPRKSPRASSRPPIARPVPAGFGAPTARRWLATPRDRQGTRAGRKGDGQGFASDPSPRRRTVRRRPNLVHDQTAFAGQRDDTCRDYVKESAPWLLRVAPDRGADRSSRDAAR